jgi:hypothetical protein
LVNAEPDRATLLIAREGWATLIDGCEERSYRVHFMNGSGGTERDSYCVVTDMYPPWVFHTLTPGARINRRFWMAVWKDSALVRALSTSTSSNSAREPWNAGAARVERFLAGPKASTDWYLGLQRDWLRWPPRRR